MLNDKTVLTGVKPTGDLHLGNYVGAIKPMIELSKQAGKSFFFIADLHSLNQIHDAKEVMENTYSIAAAYLALGVDPDHTVFFRQSDIAEVTYFSTLLTNVTPKGLMNRAHAYKAMVDKNTAAGADTDAGVNMGLYNYPILMAADIILYSADLVPVGQDQKQHIEFARDIAGSFNHLYGDVLKVPAPFIQEETAMIPGLDGRKMSKSYGNTIQIFAPESQLKKGIMRIITDSKLPEEPKDPETSTIYQLYRHFATIEQTEAMKQAFLKGGMGYGDAKKMLFEAVNAVLKPLRERYEALLADRKKLDQILAEGAAKAKIPASALLQKASKAMLGRSL